MRGWAYPDLNQMFYREVVGWKYISHPNIAPFLGISEILFSFCIISPWLSNGNIAQYIRKHQIVGRLKLVSYFRGLQTNRLKRLRPR